MRRLLIANRAEIAIRIARTADELGIETVGVHSEDDARCLHVRAVDEAHALAGRGPTAYLDVGAIVAAATSTGCDAVHPGYGFLSENAALARACEAAGLTFVGPAVETLDLFGDKTRAREAADAAGVPVLAGTGAPTTIEDARAFLAGLGGGRGVMVKAVAGGGGRGMRPAATAGELDDAFARCASEAAAAFGNGDLYIEEYLPSARHVEVQLLGDGTDVVHLWDRDCSLQRHRQKIVEIAPASAVALPADLRDAVLDAAVRIGQRASYRSLGTVEFLVDARNGRFVFLEVNPRLQVEHTVTEEVTGLDLVALQLRVAGGVSLGGLGLGSQAAVPAARGVAVETRVNLEGAGTIRAIEAPSGPRVRVDGHGYAGYRTSTRYDALLAKVVVHVPSGDTLAPALVKASRALREFRIDGPATNLPFLVGLLQHPDVTGGHLHTGLADEVAAAGGTPAVGGPRHYFEPTTAPMTAPAAQAGARLDTDDPLAVLVHGKSGSSKPPRAASGHLSRAADAPDGTHALVAPLQGTVVSVAVAEGDVVAAGRSVVVMEAMKMEHVVLADVDGIVRHLVAAPGATILEGQPVAFIEPADIGAAARTETEEVDLDEIRPDLQEVLDRHRRTLDEARPDAVERRRRHGQRTARENVEDLCDPGSFVEYGPLTVAARRRRNTMDELIAQTPADGLIMGLASVNGDLFDDEARTRCAVLAYDYTVLAGTQGAHNHVKLDRMAELALRWRLPTVFFTEGGGGRPGDTEGSGGFIRGFEFWGKLSGAVPLVGVSSGRCFAGNAAILGCCDVIIATKDSALGMGGPAMVEGGGLGVFRPEEIGPVDVMQANGTIDVLVDDEAEAVAKAKQYLAYFQGRVEHWSCADQRLLRRAIPENRVRAYDIRKLIELLADEGSVLELRPRFGLAMVTAFARIEGRPVGIIANNPQHLGGAIDSDAADKAARFLQICEAFDIPVVSLSDTPGNMVGPEAEKTGLIRHCSRLFVIGANLTVPIFSVILRKSYGLGAIAMTGGSYQASMFCVAWPTGEFGGMGLEGSVKLGYRNELAAIDDAAERKATFDRMVAAAYAAGKAVVRASGTALDDVIDPADTRRWILAGLRSLPPTPVRTEKKVPWIDSW